MKFDIKNLAKEHWVIIDGRYKLEIGDFVFYVGEDKIQAYVFHKIAYDINIYERHHNTLLWSSYEQAEDLYGLIIDRLKEAEHKYQKKLIDLYGISEDENI